MIKQETVKEIVERWLEGKDYFLVDVSVSADNSIVIEIDHADGVWIDDCVDLSKFVESHFDRDVEDFELEVGSAGLGQPFKVAQQYVNHVGKDVEVLTADGVKVKGVLSSVDGSLFTVLVNEKVLEEGKKRPVKKDVAHEYDMSAVKYCKYVFK